MKIAKKITAIILTFALFVCVFAGCSKVTSKVENQKSIYFGSLDGASIEWIKIDENDTYTTLITKDILFSHTFSKDETDRWISSSLRKNLNDVFYNNSFSEMEKNIIVPTELSNTFDYNEHKYSDESTIDYVFVLSLEEADEFFDSNDDRKATYKGEFNSWWLRTNGVPDYRNTSCVDSNGNISTEGRTKHYSNQGVRPVIVVKNSALETYLSDIEKLS